MIKMTDFLLIVIIFACVFLNDNVFSAIKNRPFLFIPLIETPSFRTMDIIRSVYSKTRELENPANYFSGQMLPAQFALPDNILAFFPRWSEPSEQHHRRYVLVLPFDKVIYCVEQSRFELKQGLGLLIHPWQRHNHLSGDRKQLCERLLITFELPEAQGYLPSSPVVFVHETAWKEIRRFLLLYHEGNAIELAWQLLKILKCLAGTPVVAAHQQLSETTTKAIRYVQGHIGEMMNIFRIASALNISPSHLRMLFRKEMHISLGKYINAQKAQKACYLLENTSLPIQEIAEECGYASIYAFSHFFKNTLSISPNHFRNQNAGPGQ